MKGEWRPHGIDRNHELMEVSVTTAKVLPQYLLRALPLTNHHLIPATVLGSHETGQWNIFPHQLWL